MKRPRKTILCHPVTIRLSTPMQAALTAHAALAGLSLSDAARDCIKAGLPKVKNRLKVKRYRARKAAALLTFD